MGSLPKGDFASQVQIRKPNCMARLLRRKLIVLTMLMASLQLTSIKSSVAQEDFGVLRLDMVSQVIANISRTRSETGVSELSAALVSALSEIPRHEFVPEELRPFAYFDIPLPVGHEQNTSQPYLIALMTALAEIKKTDRVFETGTGAGYHAAILSRLAKQVYSVEVVKPLADKAARLLNDMGFDNVDVRHADGFYGWKDQAPFDAMIIKEAVPQIPAALVNQLKRGGRLIAPVGLPDRGQMLTIIEKRSDGSITKTPLIPVRFSPLQGGERI